MIERVFAAIALAVCVLLLVRLLIGARRRHRIDSWVLRHAHQWRRTIVSARRQRAARREAVRVANELIRRARGRGNWDGNVYTPKSFRKPPREPVRKPPRDKMH